ncbi:glycoside hydrolase family 127 protein [Streptosporangium sp. 'caverna']|uniref:glycoside hydrolase family 127 protein n=1 Tax=Streptosporangium sp. 'caverna' TaxID=2202249 RepID=UPI000D7D4EB5|nr:beta-L-arabinofuranosidase domain-containing protein [Streptosporangium sp. 'caverna']AWS43593.1 glycosyl hydrolase [Streptosporangium sp. 'caverna']
MSIPPGPIRLTGSAYSALRPVSSARITGGFWAVRRRTNAQVSIPQGPALLEAAGNLANLRAAADGKGDFAGDFQFQDSDVYKWLEAASWQLAEHPGESELNAAAEKLIELLAAAQADDGYLQTYYQVAHPELRWRQLGWGHELYCAGHLIQAAVAHHRATGRRTLLDVAVRFATHIESTFGPGKQVDGVCGHPEIETALVELYRETGERRWLELARYFVDRRGHGSLHAGIDRGHDRDPGAAYWQDHVPVREATTVAGHAVRQLYLLAGATDLAMETGDLELRAALERMWDAMVESKTYITGGLGSRYEGEAFGDPYELPPDRAYAETCAAIALVQWSWRMALLTGEAKYSDLVERTLYNGFLSGVSLDGDRWLYVNPLQVREDYDPRPGDQTARRTQWFRCACCPPNVMRLLASLPHYLASSDAHGLQLHQYASGVYAAAGGTARVTTDYPWDGRVTITIEEASVDPNWTLSLRIPSWCTAFTLTGADARSEAGWVRIARRWAPGDTLTLDLELPVRLTRPDPKMDAVRGCVAIERGPIVYCVETVDQMPGLRLDDVVLPSGNLAEAHQADLFGGVTLVTADGCRRSDDSRIRLTAVPYYAWANREVGAMRVWIPQT